MILIEDILGNVKKDPVWRARLKDASLDHLVLDQREAQKSRCRKLSTQGVDLGISLDRHVMLADGDILTWDEHNNIAIVVQINLRDVMVIDLSELKKRSQDELIKTAFELGHALGNQHWKAVSQHNHVYVPLTVATTMMESVMKSHGFQHLPFHFVPGQEILPLLSNAEARLLFGGAEDTDTHVHVVSPLDDPHTGSAVHAQGHHHSHDPNHGHRHDSPSDHHHDDHQY